MVKHQCDFSGYATRNDLLCGDGRTIRRNAFKDCDGQVVPLVWNHDHNNADAVLGHALLENREDGVYAYGTFNDTEQGRHAKQLVQHGDVRSLSICANKLRQLGGDVVHGVIRELSLVLAGANPGAYIDFVLAHGDEEGESLYANYDENALVIYHSDDNKKKEESKEETSMAEETKKPESEETVADVFNTLSEKQKTVVYAMIGQALEDAGANNEEDEEDMKHNVFDMDDVQPRNVLTHSDQAAILKMAKQSNVGSFKEAMKIYAEETGILYYYTTKCEDWELLVKVRQIVISTLVYV